MRTGIALGSNIGNRLKNLRESYQRLLALHEAGFPIFASPIYKTTPVDCTPESPEYLNAVVEIEYHAPPIILLDRLQEIEQEFGRPSKRPRNAPRTIDLDILYVGNLVLNNTETIIPHPRLTQRQFVLAPLAEIRPELILPGQTLSISQLLNKLKIAENLEIVSKVAESIESTET